MLQHFKEVKRQSLLSQKHFLKHSSSLRYENNMLNHGIRWGFHNQSLDLFYFFLMCCTCLLLFLQALEHGLGGVVLKVEDSKAVLELKVTLLFYKHFLIMKHGFLSWLLSSGIFWQKKWYEQHIELDQGHYNSGSSSWNGGLSLCWSL